MRIPLKGSDYFSKQVNAAAENVQEAYLESVKPAIQMRKADAMLGDGMVAQIDTFDPQNVQTFYQRLTNQLGGWMATGISKSVTDDLHRLFCQFNREVGRYYVSTYFGVQFHALPYYKADGRVNEIQRELAIMARGAASVFQDMTDKADMALAQELEKRGFAQLDFDELFTKMFNDEKLANDLDKRAAEVEGEFSEFQEMGKKKNAMFAELRDLMIELYQTSAVAIDYNRLMQGEEGVCTYFDIEHIVKSRKGTKREAVFETKKISEDEADEVSKELLSVAKAAKKAR